MNTMNFLDYAEKMVETQINARGVTDPGISEAMKKIARHLFCGEANLEQAYGDFPLPIGCSQTISQPYMVAHMTELLELTGKEKVLEIGTGSGYQTSLLSILSKTVYTVEKVAQLYKQAIEILNSLNYNNIFFLNSDGSLGWQEHAPYDRIIVTAAMPAIPDIFKEQLSENGIMVIPVGDYKTYQTLITVRRKNRKFETVQGIACRFVPLIGEFGF